jgi:hypothetical protein
VAAVSEWKRGAIPSVISVALATLLIDVLVPYDLEAGLVLLGAIAVAYFLVALFIGRVYGAASGFNILWMGLGIAIGTFVAAMVVEMFIGNSRNLWPFAIVIYWVIGILPVTIGVLLGAFWRTHSTRPSAQ